MKTIIIITILLLVTIVWSAPVPAQSNTEETSRTHFNLGVSSHRNSLDLSSQNLGNLAQIANQKIQTLSRAGNSAILKTAAVPQIVAAPQQKFSLLNNVQVICSMKLAFVL